MHTSLLSLLSLAPLLSRVVASPCQASPPNAKAIYILSNDEENAVIALPVQSDGSVGPLESATRTVTQGTGSSGIDGMNNEPAAPDSLFSQSALTVVGNNLFAVNPGSNSLTMFAIDEADPTKLTIVCEPLALPGEFPVTVAASEQVGIVCVGFSGAKAGVSCSNFSEDGMGDMDDLRTFELGQSTPPVGPLNTVSQVFFSEDGSTLFSTVKGDPTVNNTGFLASFPVVDGAVDASVTRDSPQGTAVLFGTNVIPGTQNLFATDASFGAAVLDVSTLGQAEVVGMGAIEGQAATCWVAISRATNTAFVTDVAVNRLVEMSLTDASIVSMTDLSSNGDPGLIDLAAAGMYVYALSPGNGTTPAAVTVVNAMNKKQVQHQDLQSLGVGGSAMGMAMM